MKPFTYTTIYLILLISPIGGIDFWKTILNFFRKRCDDRTSFNYKGLDAELKNKVFGQHLASAVVLRAVSVFMHDKNPPKPLVLSFHGGSGTGKNHIAKIIAQNLFSKGEHSKQVHWFIGDYHFNTGTNIEACKVQLQQWIRGNVSACPHSMFIFDEMDKMNPELIDSIRPSLDHYDNIDGVSYRHAIFLFIGNAGASAINQVTLNFWKEGEIREEIQLSSQDLENEISKEVFNNKKSGLWHSSLINKNVVDFFVPFLPLEFRHVRLCALEEMRALALPPKQKIAEQAAREMPYFPREERVFSVKGCKGSEPE
ncbi:hypothetical protein AGOR_G00195500 [Albula goreensis]|uniref:Torsin-1A C-terminal domain-containing protein n=1 Tax=Albula goreensis TaxID=1534307 RepID=A0A8T3CZC3_9TELE|nr:hypothetical protein AGOR_G00195500 [Albula goreensis]